jgi:hypothetical protein
MAIAKKPPFQAQPRPTSTPTAQAAKPTIMQADATSNALQGRSFSAISLLASSKSKR